MQPLGSKGLRTQFPVSASLYVDGSLFRPPSDMFVSQNAFTTDISSTREASPAPPGDRCTSCCPPTRPGQLDQSVYFFHSI